MEHQRIKQLSRQATWLLPGLYIKRWLGILLTGFVCLVVGVALLLNLQPITLAIDLIKTIAPIIPSWMSGSLFMLTGILMLLFGLRKTTFTVFDALGGKADPDILEALYRRNRLDHGPHTVTIGGGTGLSNLLLGLKHYTNNITAVVTVADDGGSSGRLRQEFGIIPPGDIRNCIAALADEEQLITELFQYRFKSGHGLEGHSFGNLFLSVLCSITGNMVQAVKESSKVLNIRGRVLPASLDNLCLVAQLENGSEIYGESHIAEAKSRIVRLRCEPVHPEPLPEVIQAIETAELIILGPGSLYTSVLPNLLIPAVTEAIHRSRAAKIYVCNVMTQPGETDGFAVSDHIQILLEHCPGKNLVDAVVVNNWIPERLVERYKQYDSVPVLIDRDRLDDMGISLIERVLVDEGQTIRHNPRRLSRSIIHWFKKEFRRRAKHVENDQNGSLSASTALQISPLDPLPSPTTPSSPQRGTEGS
jgi:uncharacterized cofD-like protein